MKYRGIVKFVISWEDATHNIEFVGGEGPNPTAVINSASQKLVSAIFKAQHKDNIFEVFEDIACIKPISFEWLRAPIKC